MATDVGRVRGSVAPPPLILHRILIVLLVAAAGCSCAASPPPAPARFIVSFTASPQSATSLTRSIAERLSINLEYLGAMSGDAHIVRYAGSLRPDQVLQKLQSFPEIRYAVREQRRTTP